MLAGISGSEPATFAARRHHFQVQPDRQITPIEKIRLPLKSRDELPPLLAGKKATGRTGMDLWQILVLGVVRLGLDADWDRMADRANHHTLIRQMLGLPAAPWADESKRFGHQTLRDDERRQEIHARMAAAGRAGFAKKGGAPLAALAVKVDTYVLESDVPFPTALNLLWDAGRKCVDLILKYRDQCGYALPGWRKAKEWRRQLKNLERTASHIVYRGGPNQEARMKRAVRDSLAVGHELSVKVRASGEWPALTTMHEIGHFLDLDAIGKKGSYATLNGFDLMRQVLAAAGKTEAIRALRAKNKAAPDERTEYLLNPQEVFARAYAQFIAERAGSSVLPAQLRTATKASELRQWQTADLALIAKVIETMFQQLGWL